MKDQYKNSGTAPKITAAKVDKETTGAVKLIRELESKIAQQQTQIDRMQRDISRLNTTIDNLHNKIATR